MPDSQDDRCLSLICYTATGHYINCYSRFYFYFESEERKKKFHSAKLVVKNSSSFISENSLRTMWIKFFIRNFLAALILSNSEQMCYMNWISDNISHRIPIFRKFNILPVRQHFIKHFSGFSRYIPWLFQISVKFMLWIHKYLFCASFLKKIFLMRVIITKFYKLE